MTKKTIRALHVISNHPKGLTAAEFALQYWPDDEHWIIQGSGRGMLAAAIFYLSRLIDMGFVVKVNREDCLITKRFSWIFKLSAKGKMVITQKKWSAPDEKE